MGLWLNVRRADAKRSVQHARGAWLAADDDGEVGREFVDAACLLEEEVDEVDFKTRRERERRRVLRKYRML